MVIEAIVHPGELVKIRTREENKVWEGIVLESYDSEIILLKLNTGYNIGIRESNVLDIDVLKKSDKTEKGFNEKEIIENKKSGLKNIALIVTGGTISSRLDSKTGGVKWTSVKDLFDICPEIKEICNVVQIERPFMKGSEDMDIKDWKIISEKVSELLNNPEIDGIVITHGTDTLHFTSSALSFFIQDLNKPVALTYSQRSIDRASTDASLNLLCAFKYAISDIAEIALVGHEDLNDNFCLAMPGTKVRKMHSSRRDAFKVINSSAFARISKNSFDILRDFNARTTGKVKLDNKFEDKIGLIKVHPGQNPEILDYYLEKGYKGVVIEATGLGHVPGKDSRNNWLIKIKNLIKQGVYVCFSAQTIYGGLNPKVYSTGRELEKLGIIFLKDMLSETALIKLGWVLGHSKWDVKEKMLENISNEFLKYLIIFLLKPKVYKIKLFIIRKTVSKIIEVNIT
jgi:glutamyl-tRNA(Gln) amidotransferase subunit D